MLRIIPTRRVSILPARLIQAPSSVRFVWKSVARRRKIRRLDIDSPEDPLPLFEQMSKEPIQAKPGARKKGLPKDSPGIRASKTLAWILRHGAKSEGITMRPDGYVEVSELLQNNRLRNVNLTSLQEIVKKDPKNRYSLIYESGIWLIRANQGHSLKAVQMELQPITSARDIPMAVHGTTREAWRSISTQGLSRMNRNHIHFAQGLAGDDVISGMRRSSQILIYIDVQKALDSGLEFFLSTNGVVLSEGDENGFISPMYFRRVESANRMALPGWGIDSKALKALVEDLPPVVAGDLDQAAEGGTGVEDPPASDVVSTSRPSEHEPPELIEKLQNVELK